jgi:hypothetical protein
MTHIESDVSILIGLNNRQSLEILRRRRATEGQASKLGIMFPAWLTKRRLTSALHYKAGSVFLGGLVQGALDSIVAPRSGKILADGASSADKTLKMLPNAW